jgi:prepilin-type N-terminal cleavage/methylation domain-containing protein
MKEKNPTSQKGFTLIEILVVVAIIGVLGGVVLSSLNKARGKNKDAFLKAQAAQMRSLLELEYAETGSYAGLQSPGAWIANDTECEAATFTSVNYATQARNMCKAIVAVSRWIDAEPNLKFYLGTKLGLPNQYSIMIALPYKKTYFCMGSSGANSDIETETSGGGAYDEAGCWAKP